MGSKNLADHLANERTFLAWIRTSVGIMAFGFVVEKFALFVRQMAYVLKNTYALGNIPKTPGYSAVIGVMLVLLGAAIAVFAYVRFRTTAKQIENESYKPYFLIDFVITAAVLIIGVVLALYLKPAGKWVP